MLHAGGPPVTVEGCLLMTRLCPIYHAVLLSTTSRSFDAREKQLTDFAS